MQVDPKFSESQTHLLPQHLTDASSIRDDADSITQHSLNPVAFDDLDSASPRASIGPSDDVRRSHDVDIDTAPTETNEPRRRYGSLGQYRSEEAYLNDLRAFVEAKQYYRPGELSSDGYRTLEGFYGNTTMVDYANRPGAGLHLHRKQKSKDAACQGPARRATVDESAGQSQRTDDHLEPQPRKRRNNITDLLRRQRGR